MWKRETSSFFVGLNWFSPSVAHTNFSLKDFQFNHPKKLDVQSPNLCTIKTLFCKCVLIKTIENKIAFNPYQYLNIKSKICTIALKTKTFNFFGQYWKEIIKSTIWVPKDYFKRVNYQKKMLLEKILRVCFVERSTL